MILSESHRSFGTILIATLAGFTLSLLIFVIMTHMMWPEFPMPLSLHSQLVAGTIDHTKYPSSDAVFQDFIQGHNPMAIALTSYFWWIGMMIGGVIAAFFFIRAIERYKDGVVYESVTQQMRFI